MILRKIIAQIEIIIDINKEIWLCSLNVDFVSMGLINLEMNGKGRERGGGEIFINKGEQRKDLNVS